MPHERAIRVALTFGAALPLLWLVVATTDIRQTASSASSPAVTILARPPGTGAPSADTPDGVNRLFEATLGFVREISRSFERGDYAGAVIRLLIIVEVLIAALGAVSCVTVRGKVNADLVYRIVDVMGALFILIALLLFGMMTASRGHAFLVRSPFS
jgi:hypothetical protein